MNINTIKTNTLILNKFINDFNLTKIIKYIPILFIFQILYLANTQLNEFVKQNKQFDFKLILKSIHKKNKYNFMSNIICFIYPSIYSNKIKNVHNILKNEINSLKANCNELIFFFKTLTQEKISLLLIFFFTQLLNITIHKNSINIFQIKILSILKTQILKIYLYLIQHTHIFFILKYYLLLQQIIFLYKYKHGYK